MKTITKTISLLLLITFIFACENETSQNTVEENQEDILVSDEIAQKAGPWTRQFTDNFDNTVSTSKWERTNRRDYNSNNCEYVSGNPRVTNFDNRSCLELSAYRYSNRYRSGHVKSRFSFKPNRNEQYRVSASIKLIAKQGSNYKGFAQTYGAWPAFWTVKEQNWPTGGEIDIMEGYSFGNSSHFASNLFYGTSTGQNLLETNAERRYPNSEGWHTYDLYWTNINGNVYLDILVDGNKVANYYNGIDSDLRLQNFGPHNVIFNLNVGSDTGIFDNSRINLFSRTYMYVDYVHVDKRTL